jgi:HD-GYP domain-containing protein (c-di-GMP phosphodiesterase class II)
VTRESQSQRILLGEGFLRALHRLIHIARIHQDNNNLLIECTRKFVDTLILWWKEEESLRIQISRGRFFLQDEKLLYQRQNVGLMEEMLQFFDKRALGGLTFHSSLKAIPFDLIWEFARILDHAERQEDPFSWLSEKLGGQSFSWVEVLPHSDVSREERDRKRKEMARRTYTYALSSVKEVSQKLQGGVGVRKLKRIVQSMVDLLSEDEPVLLGMSTVRDYDDYTYTHSVNVAILSLCLGRYIGLSRLSLRMLGICGLVHDLGKLDIPLEILKKPGRLTEKEFRES